MSSFASLKKHSSSKNFKELTNKLKNEGKSSYEADERYWQFEVDKAGNGFAIIRFMSEPDGEENPYVKLYEYGFKNKVTGKWYINKSRQTIDQPDPVEEAWEALWNQGKKEEAKKYSRRTQYISNILVVSDPKHPENEGKVFLWKYGVRIFQKLQGAIEPQFEDETPLNPFDMWNGANFKLKARLLDGMRSYDKSEFESPSAVAKTDEEIEAIWRKCYSLADEIAPSKFKSYDELKKRFNDVVGLVGQAAAKPEAPKAKDEEEEDTPPWHEEREEQHEEPPKEAAKPSEDDDDDMAAYRKLLDD